MKIYRISQDILDESEQDTTLTYLDQYKERSSSYDSFHKAIEEAYLAGWDARLAHRQGEWMMINPELRNSPKGRAFLRGWNDCNFPGDTFYADKYRPKKAPADLMTYIKTVDPEDIKISSESIKMLRTSYEIPRHDSPYWTEVDKHTLMVGKIKTVADAKRMAASLPSPGKEVLVDSGTVTLNYTPAGSSNAPFTYEQSQDGIPKRYKTYLQNNAGSFRVWTWISV